MSTTSSPPLVLVTGANGFIGYGVVACALEAGYHVRAAVRRQDGIDTVSRGPTVQRFLSTRALTFVLIPDYTEPGAFDAATSGCSFIIHIASPLPFQPGDLVAQALAGTKAILEAAEKTASVKRVIMTSSTAALYPFERSYPQHPYNQNIAAGRADEVETMTANARVPTPAPVSDESLGFHRYNNSKVAALNFIEEYMSQRNPHFSVVNIMPGFVLGPEELVRNKREAFKGSNAILYWLFGEFDWNPLLGFPAEAQPAVLALVVSLKDTVEAHVKAMDVDKVRGKYRSFMLSCEGPEGPDFSDLDKIVRKAFPEQVKSGKIKFKGKKLGSIKQKIDTAGTERDLLGHAFEAYEMFTAETVGWYIELPD